MVRFLHQRLHVLLELGDQVAAVLRQRAGDGVDGGLDLALVLGKIAAPVVAYAGHLLVRDLRHPRRTVGVQVDLGAGEEEVCPVEALLLQEFEEGELVREGIRRVPVEVVEVPQLVVEEAGGAGEGQHMLRAELLDVPQRPGHAVAPLAGTEGPLHPLGKGVRPGEPDGARILHEMGVQRPELLDRAQLDGPRIILVEETDPAVVQGNTGIAERPVEWRVHRAALYP
ncbi:hypothetical protein [Streptomyces sp. ISID311]|uniref:hypothetical protein n=1 Tax=Streptomyces sp. ISID311 TaxID=2601673 RepID=UPI0021C2AF4A|nr:hypothetical protein [Streptomyces sp. ISID311]